MIYYISSGGINDHKCITELWNHITQLTEDQLFLDYLKAFLAMHFLEGMHLSPVASLRAWSLAVAMPTAYKLWPPLPSELPLIVNILQCAKLTNCQKKTTWMSLQFPFCIQPQWSLGSYCILTSGKPQPISRVFRRKWFHPLCAPLPSVQNPAHSKDRSRNSESLQHHEKRSSQSWQNSRDTDGFWRTALTYCINKQLQHTKVVGWGWYQKSHHHVTAWRQWSCRKCPS